MERHVKLRFMLLLKLTLLSLLFTNQLTHLSRLKSHERAPLKSNARESLKTLSAHQLNHDSSVTFESIDTIQAFTMDMNRPAYCPFILR